MTHQIIEEIPIIKTTYFTLRNSKIILSLVPKNNQVLITNLYLQQRNSIKEKRFSFNVSKKRLGSRNHYKCILDVSKHLQDMESAFWDIVVEATIDGVTYNFILSGLSTWLKIRLVLFPRWTKTKNQYIIYPFVNGARQFSIQYRRYQKKYDNYLFIFKEYLALFCYFILKPFWDNKSLWLICEKYCEMAQDNAFYFFKYCMDNLTESEKKHIYYVIDNKAADSKALIPYQNNVIQFMSFKYMIWLCAAQYLISTDAIRHFYIWDSPNSVYKVLYQMRKHLIFLQHGVTGFKQCHNTYRKSGNNTMTLFVTTSPHEKEIIKTYFGYDDQEIIVTGFPRWDVLRDTSSIHNKRILIMPTWRKWLEDVSHQGFTSSEYYKNYRELLNSPRLKQILQSHNITLDFYLHPKFREYIGIFSTNNPNINMIGFGEQPLNQLLMNCNMLITDYSSVAWDVFYQKKPVIFYTFDLDTYNQHHGSYMDLRTEAFGDLVVSTEQLLDKIQQYISNDFKESQLAANKRDTLLPIRDQENSKRIYEAIKACKAKPKLISGLAKALLHKNT